MDNIIVARARGQTITTRKRRVSFTTNTFLTLAFIITLFSVPASAVELMENGGFEASPYYSSWLGYPPLEENPVLPEYVILDHTNAYSGSNCVFIRNGRLSQNFSIASGANITFSYMLNVSNVGSTSAYVMNWSDFSIVLNLDPDWVIHEGVWERQIASQYLPAGEYFVTFYAETSNAMYLDEVSIQNDDIPNNTSEIWYSSENGVLINWNYSNWLLNNSNYGIPIKAFIWENTSSDSFYHSDDMLSFGSSLPYGSVSAQYPEDSSKAELYLIFLNNNQYQNQYVGTAYWHGGGTAVPNSTNYTLPIPPEAPPISLPDWLNGTAPPLNFSLPDLLRPEGNFSAVNTYLDFIDSVFDPIREFTFAVANFILSPISFITDYINKATAQFNQIANSIVNAGFLAEVVRPFMMAIPTKISMLIAFSLLLSIIAYLLRYR